MNLFRKIEPRIIPWYENDRCHVTHALVAGEKDTPSFEVFKTARSLQEAQLYLSNFEKFGPHALLPSEVSKYLHLIWPYLEKPCLDLGSGGYPVTDFVIQIEQPSDAFNSYTGGRQPDLPIQIHGDIFHLPFKDGTIGSIVASHLIEDWPRDKWVEFFIEWKRVLRPGGHLVVFIPEAARWQHCIQVLGQCPNCSHSMPEPEVGNFTAAAHSAGFTTILRDSLTDQFQFDYSILGIAVKN